jgi:hypothetical protein
MQFTSQVKVTGMKFNKGILDNGTAYDSTKVYIETSLDESKGNAKGFASAEYTFGMSKEFTSFAALDFPFAATAVFEQVTNGKSQKTVMISLKPLSPKAA